LHDAFADAREQVEEELLIDHVALTPDDRGTHDTCDESIEVPSFARQVSQYTLRDFVNEDEEAEVATVLPRQAHSLL